MERFQPGHRIVWMRRSGCRFDDTGSNWVWCDVVIAATSPDQKHNVNTECPPTHLFTEPGVTQISTDGEILVPVALRASGPGRIATFLGRTSKMMDIVFGRTL